MPNLFSSKPGIVGVVADDALPVTIDPSGWNQGFGGAITGYDFSGKGSQQFMLTLQDFIYVYVFGENVGEVTIEGVTFLGKCGGGSAGVDDLFNFYNQNRLSSTGRPVSISLASSTAVQGFLVGFGTKIVDSQAGLGQFGLKFVYPPKT